jgi:serine/threonine protein kinase
MVDKLLGRSFARQFRLDKCINEGAFGKLYMALNVQSGQHVAVKVEPVDARFPQVLYEHRVYELLQGGLGVPRPLWAGTEHEHNALVLPLLGYSLEELFTFCKRRFTLRTVLLLGADMLQRLQHVHSRGLLHRDVKPDNFLFGLGAGAHTLFLIDYGLSKCYLDPKTQEHIPHRTDKELTGTPRYASVRTHEGHEQSRRDDLESLAYVLLYFLRGGLEWQGKRERAKNGRYAGLLEKKNRRPEEVCGADAPPELTAMLKHARELAFDAAPEYASILGAFNGALARHGWVRDGTYDWSAGVHSR